MNPIEYRNFDLLIEHAGDEYRVKVSLLEGGEVTSTFDKPFSEQELEEFLTLVGYPWKNGRALNAREIEEEAKKFGGRLFDKVFSRGVYARLRTNLDKAQNEGKGLRIRLRLQDVPELADLPWEYLYDTESKRFLFLSVKTPLVRYLEMPERIRPFPVKPPLRFLVMISNPADSRYSPLDVETEWEQLNESLDDLRQSGQVELVRVEATAFALQNILQQGTFHIFHFIGHGGFDDENQDGFLVMSDETFPTLSGEGLGRLLQDHDTLRLVVLNACESARGSRSNPFSGVAQSLVKYEIPAVISMQFEITDEAAIEFSKAFYNAMANYYPVDAALAEARKALSGNTERKALSRNTERIEWGTPALYMRPSDGAIFAEKGSPASPPPPDPIVKEEEYDPNEVEYQRIRTALTKGRLVLFLGARINLCNHAGNVEGQLFPPSDEELAARLARIYRPPGEVSGLARISQFFALKSTEVLSTELYSALTDFSCLTSLHKFLAMLPGILREKGYRFPYQLIVTTNYDDALEKAFEGEGEEGEPFDLIYYETEGGLGGRFCYKPWRGDMEPIINGAKFLDSLLEERTVILKIHGTVRRASKADRFNPEPRRYAVTEDDYIHYLSGKSIGKTLPKQLIGELKKSRYLFLGYRLLDWNLRIFCHRVLEGDWLPPDSWVIQSETDPLDEEFWISRDVKRIKVSQEEFVDKLQRRLQALPRVGGV